MGADLINKAKGSIRKARERHKAHMSCELTATTEEVRTIRIKPTNGFCFAQGQDYELHLSEGKLSVYHERVLIGISDCNAPAIIEDIKSVGGKALGKFNRTRVHSGYVDISVHTKK